MRPGQQLDVWGPLGNGFQSSQPSHCTESATSTTSPRPSAPHHGRRRHRPNAVPGPGPRSPRPESATAIRPRTCRGPRASRSATALARPTISPASTTFERLGIDVRLATDDGSRGHHGLVTDLLKQVLAENRGQSADRLLRPGADDGSRRQDRPRRRAFPARSRSKRRWPAASASASPASPKSAKPDGGWDYKRTCVEGPVFDAELIEW